MLLKFKRFYNFYKIICKSIYHLFLCDDILLFCACCKKEKNQQPIHDSQMNHKSEHLL